MKLCDCYFCENGKNHTSRHNKFIRVSDYVLKPESLDPKDRIKVEACVVCGHKRVMA